MKRKFPLRRPGVRLFGVFWNLLNPWNSTRLAALMLVPDFLPDHIERSIIALPRLGHFGPGSHDFLDLVLLSFIFVLCYVTNKAPLQHPKRNDMSSIV